MKEMSVLAVTHLHPRFPGDTYGIFVQKKLAALAKLCRVEALVAIPTHGLSAYSQGPWDDTDGFGYPVKFIPYPTTPGFSFGGAEADHIRGRLLAAVRGRRGDFTAIESHGLFPAGCHGPALASYLGVRAYAYLHGRDVFRLQDGDSYYRDQYAATLRAFERVAFNSTRLARVSVWRTRIGGDVFHPGGAVEPTGIDKIPGRIVFAGRLISQKGAAALIRALSHVQGEVSCRIVGDGPERPLLERLAADLPPGRVTFLGALPHADTLREIEAAQAIVMPVRNEAFGLVCAEAMSLRTAVCMPLSEGLAPDAPLGSIFHWAADPQGQAAAIERALSAPSDILDAAAAWITRESTWDVAAERALEWMRPNGSA